MNRIKALKKQIKQLQSSTEEKLKNCKKKLVILKIKKKH